MNITIETHLDSSAPECMGILVTNPNGSTRVLNVVQDDLVPKDKKTYTDFVALGGSAISTSIANTGLELEISRPISTGFQVSERNFDYPALTSADQAKVDAFINLVNKL